MKLLISRHIKLGGSMSSNISSTEYDDVFRTMLNDFPNLAIPFIIPFTVLYF